MMEKEMETSKKYKITVVAEREDELLGMLQQNQQDHMIQFLQMGFHSININIRKTE